MGTGLRSSQASLNIYALSRREIIVQEANPNPMSGVFQNIEPPPPSSPGECVVYPPPPPPLVRGKDTLAGWTGGGGGVNILEDARHCSVLYIRGKWYVRVRVDEKQRGTSRAARKCPTPYRSAVAPGRRHRRVGGWDFSK